MSLLPGLVIQGRDAAELRSSSPLLHPERLCTVNGVDGENRWVVRRDVWWLGGWRGGGRGEEDGLSPFRYAIRAKAPRNASPG